MRCRRHRSSWPWVAALAGAFLGVTRLLADDLDTLRLEWRDFTTGGTDLKVCTNGLTVRPTLH
jgi:hypothetical protein